MRSLEPIAASSGRVRHRMVSVPRAMALSTRIPAEVVDVWREHGLRSAWVVPSRFAEFYYFKLVKRQSFTVGGVRYPHFYHLYNTTFRKERAIELALATDFVEKLRGKRVLELGNVLRHYGTFHHDVVDKYERYDGVINEDIVDYRSSKLYDGIVSVSTIEHIGWDEEPKDPEKPRLAIEALRGLLAPGGSMLIIMPLGYNPSVDALVASSDFEADEVHFLKRVNAGNDWVETAHAEVAKSRYGAPYPNANALWVAYWNRPGSAK